MALCASSSELISTKPKPRERPVARSVRIVALTHVPALENNSRRSLSDVSKDRLPTNSFLPMSFSSWEKDGVPTMGTHGTHGEFQSGRTFLAAGPFWPSPISNSTLCPSLRLLYPCPLMPE